MFDKFTISELLAMEVMYNKEIDEIIKNNPELIKTETVQTKIKTVALLKLYLDCCFTLGNMINNPVVKYVTL